MSRIVLIACDKCSTPISGGHAVIQFVAGELATTRDDPLDLCSTCANEFVDWLKPRRFELETAGTTGVPA
jgi:hypothetical protein